MKRFTVPCDFAGTKHPFHVYIGEPCSLRHALYYQSEWLRLERGGVVPEMVINAFRDLLENARTNQVNYEDLCVHALRQAEFEQNTVIEFDFAQAKEDKKNKESAGLLSASIALKPCRFFDLFEVSGENLEGLCEALSHQVMRTQTADFHEHALARHLLSLILLIVSIQNPADWIKNLRDYLSENDEQDNASYALSVSIDCFGYVLPIDLIALADFYLFCVIELRRQIRQTIRQAIVQWATATTSAADIEMLEKYEVTAEDYLSLKKTLKTVFHPL